MDGYPEQTDNPMGTDFVMPPKEEEKESPEIGVIRELSPKKVLEQLRWKMKGYEWNPVNKKYEKVEGMQPLMNDVGISKYLSIMSAVITDLVTFGNYRDEEVPHLVQYICDSAIPTIAVNYKEYGVKDKSDLMLINTQIFILSYAAFKKALGAGDRNVIRGTISENIMSKTAYGVGQTQKDQRGFLGRINPFSR